MFCGSCGQQNPVINRFCFECGARVGVAGTDTTLPLTDAVAARLQGLGGLPEPVIEWPDDLPRQATGKDGARLKLVPAGFFWMGTKKLKRDERPLRLVYQDSFYIDEVPVTNGRYAAFLDDTTRRAPKHFRVGASDAGWESLPVSFVTWDDASAYARWALRRLPTESEWEKAARGVDGRLFPWGESEPSAEHATFGAAAGRSPVGARVLGASPYGCLDMAGNVWEWCDDQYDQDFYPRSSPRNPRCVDGDPRYRVLRGGAFGYSAFTLRCSYRGWNLPHMQAGTYGFRCAVDASRFRRSR